MVFNIHIQAHGHVKFSLVTCIAGLDYTSMPFDTIAGRSGQYSIRTPYFRSPRAWAERRYGGVRHPAAHIFMPYFAYLSGLLRTSNRSILSATSLP